MKVQPLWITAEQSVLPFIQEFILVRGVSPTLDEIATRFSKTREWARLCVNHLVKAKKLKRKKYAKRALTLVLNK